MLCAPRAAPSTGPAWLEQAVFYQIYPQSFYDSNGDGVGDIPGITRKLDYLHWLGVNALWINPCFESPFCDAGYDISDYYTVARRYGTNADLETLFARAGDRGIRVLLDLVPGHTSVEHSWFKASCRRERNEYSDWYVWTDGVWKQPEGLRSVNGFAERDGNYITNFFWCQPALNYGFAAPDPRQPWQQPVDAPGPQRVRQELRNIMRFWLHRGASGFRVDMANSLVKKDPGEREVMGLWSDVRGWLDREYPDAALVSEWSNPVHAIPAGFHADFCLMDGGMAGSAALFRKSQRDPYGWSFFDPAGRGNIREFLDEYLEQYEATRGRGFIALVTGNHDVNPRLAEGRSQRDLVCAFTFLLTMPGTPFIYYGDEIGMRSVQGLASKEGGYDRTASRTPMQWDASANAGSVSYTHLTLPTNREV